MTGICTQFDQYRDGELDAGRRASFEAHLPGCDECLPRMRLLDNLARALEEGEPRIPAAFATRVAAQAFAGAQSWDRILLSWLPLRHAWVAAALAVWIFAALVWVSSRPASQTYGKYETLVEESEKLVQGEKIQGYDEFRALVSLRGEKYD